MKSAAVFVLVIVAFVQSCACQEKQQTQKLGDNPNPLFDWLHLKGVDKLPWTAAMKPLEDMFGAQAQQYTGQLYNLFPPAKDAYQQALQGAEQFTSQLDRLPSLGSLGNFGNFASQIPGLSSLTGGGSGSSASGSSGASGNGQQQSGSRQQQQ